MPRGDKSKYTDKQKRQAEHIEESYEKKGVPEKDAEKRAWATVNAETKGGKAWREWLWKKKWIQPHLKKVVIREEKDLE